MKLIKFIPVVFVLFFGSSFVENSGKERKINGIALEAPSERFENDFFDEIHDVNADWVCLIPYADSKDGSPEFSFQNHSWKWWGETEAGIKESIEMAKSKDIQCMIKPHLWVRNGSYTGDFDLKTNEEWKQWENGYYDYILTFARLAEYSEAPLFCIGTEMKNFVNKRPTFWKNLIQDVRKVYHGKLTYAGNWDSYKTFPHWELLDYIGVDAYYPLSDNKVPTVHELTEGWKPWKKELQKISEKYNKTILFTEYGYCSVEYCAKQPWGENRDLAINYQAQKNAYTALFDSFWEESWFAGGFLWKWHVGNHFDEDRLQHRFTPQGKEALEVLRVRYE